MGPYMESLFLTPRMGVLARPLVDNSHRLFMELLPCWAHVTNPSFNQGRFISGEVQLPALYRGGMMDSWQAGSIWVQEPRIQ